MSKEYIWMKLRTDFFKNRFVNVIKKLPEGHKYVVIWLKLLLHGIEMDTPGVLRFSESIPYDCQLLASALDEDISIMSTAINIFTKYEMIKIMDNGDIFVEACEKYVGKHSTSTERVRRFREKQKLLLKDETLQNVTGNTPCNQEREREREEEKEREKEREREEEKLPPHVKLCNQYAVENFNRFMIHPVIHGKHYLAAKKILDNNPGKYDEIIKRIPCFFENPYWFNTKNRDCKTIDKSQLSIGVFLAHCLEIVVDESEDMTKNNSKVCSKCGRTYSMSVEHGICDDCYRKKIREEK